MDITACTPLLGHLSARDFMRRHWQKSPLLVRQAVPGGLDLVSRADLFRLAAREDVESRLIVRRGDGWRLRAGPLPRAALPALKQPRWTLLVQGLDLHVGSARALLERFRFIPDARLDDVMLSFATDGGGVGPHVDSYDVFLIQAHGRRRWRIAAPAHAELVPDVPLKILARFEPQQEWVLAPGDMLYLPPGWAHDGEAVGECTTCSIGFRAPQRDELARDILQRLVEASDDGSAPLLYRDPRQVATLQPARIPPPLRAFAGRAVARLLRDPGALDCALGEVLSEPKRGVWFDPSGPAAAAESSLLCLDRRTRMMYDDERLFINGESFRASGLDASLMRELADSRQLGVEQVRRLSRPARGVLDEWLQDGWAHWQPVSAEEIPPHG